MRRFNGCGAPRGSSPTQRTHEYTNDQVPHSGDDAPPQLQPLAGGGGGQPKGKKKRWEAPRIKSGQLFESNSLACGKDNPGTDQCQQIPTMS